MEDHRSQFRQALIDAHDDELERIWQHVFPDMPKPTCKEDTLRTMHAARTAARFVPRRGRFYSHRWLQDRGCEHLSQLPMNLRPKCDQYYAGVKSAVGFAYSIEKDWMKPAKPFIEKVVHAVIMDCHANGDVENRPELVRDLMLDAKNAEFKKLFGVMTSAEIDR